MLIQRETPRPAPLPRRPERECPEAASRHERAGDCEEQRRIGDECAVDNLREALFKSKSSRTLRVQNTTLHASKG